ncbi:MAG TPA: hypothetical protein ENG71_01580 [Thermoplasmatales archaeon]|nr:hypothetical protein [Thermoplasmatales archaeon]
MANAKELFSNPREFVSAIVEIRNKIGYKLLYAPAIANPLNMAILSYCGIDLFDSLDIILKSRKGVYFTSEKEYKLDELEGYPCNCEYCKKGIDDFEDLLFHNYEVMRNELIKIRNAIKRRELREYVEAKTHFNPNFASIIRILDMKYYDYQEKNYAVIGNKIIASPYSLYRPDIRRFRERILNRYEKPRNAKVLVLLPCSAKKPYSTSKSHKLFNRAIANSINRYTIHEVIVTSPLGLVPRELECTYAAAHYDISVIGYWDKEEIEMIRNTLSDYLERNKYDLIINHLPKELSNHLDIDAINTCKEHPTSDASLEALAEAVKEADDMEKVKHTERRFENARSILLYQFGKNIDNFLKNCKVKGKFPDYKIYDENDKQLASFSMKRGLFSLTYPGGKKLGRNYWVEIEDFTPKGSVFAVGIEDADERIRIGDEVVIFHNDEVRAVGVAKMNAYEMKESKAGEAIKVRHYKS